MCAKQIMIAFPSWFTCIVSVLCEFTGGWSLQYTKKTNNFAVDGYCLIVHVLLFITAETQMGHFWVYEREQLYNINH